MPLTERENSYAPADFVERILRVHPTSAEGHERLNYATHFALGSMWGLRHRRLGGLRGQKARRERLHS